MIKKKLLIIHQEQFGYHSDTYYYCKYLRKHYAVSYICWDYNKKKIYLDDVRVVYLSRTGNIAVRNMRFIANVLHEMKNNHHYHFMKYFRGCSLLKTLKHQKLFLLDIRSSSTLKKKINRTLYNLLMKTEASLFKNISVISESLAEKMAFYSNSKRIYILPLGAEVISPELKKFNALSLLYIGTLHSRNIDQTLEGFAKFYHRFKNQIKIRYTIIGTGFYNEENELKEIVKKHKLEKVTKILGYIPHDELKPFFDSHNIGVSYVPKTDYFDVQPPTKTFEYLLSGMPVIATSTLENKRVITPENGILINDSAENFYNGLLQICQKRTQFNSNTIRQEAMQYSWERITDKLNRILTHLK